MKRKKILKIGGYSFNSKSTSSKPKINKANRGSNNLNECSFDKDLSDIKLFIMGTKR